MRPSIALLCLACTLGTASETRSATAQSATTTTAAPAEAQVTFYSNGNFLKSALPGYKYGKFIGRIMDEYDQLAMLTPGRFITFNLDPGPHTFSSNSWLIPRPEGGGHLEITLIAGQHYYIATYIRPLGYLTSYRLEQRTCQEANQDNVKTQPLSREHLKDFGRARVSLETSFPACPSSPPVSPPAASP